MQFFKHLTDPALKRLYKFVLKRMIGRFLADDNLDLDQLDVHLRSGKIELCDLLLNAEVLNAELCEAHGLPFRVKKGYLGSVRVSISYANIMSESCLVEVDDIEIVLVPLNRDEGNDAFNYAESSAEPLASSGTATSQAQNGSSAAAAPKNTPNKDSTSPSSKPNKNEHVDEISQEGLDFVASWIEQVTSKIKVTLSNICLRLETGEQHRGRDIALLCKLDWAQFTDESASEVESVYGYGRSSFDGGGGTQSFGAGIQSMAASTMFGISQKGIKFRGVSMELLLSPDEDSVRAGISDPTDLILHPFLASDPSRQCYVQVKISHYEALEAPAIDADIFFHSIRIVLQPQHFPELGTLIDAFSTDLSALEKKDPYRSATSMYQSICEQQPAWMKDDDADSDHGGDDGTVNLSLKEFSRIEQLLVQYRQTHDDLKMVQRRTSANRAPQSPRESAFPTRKLSAAESVESCGLSDLDDDDSFFECDPGASSISGNVHFGATSVMAQSMYASALYDNESSDDDAFQTDRASMSRSASLPQARSSRQVVNRVKLHLLECEIVLLYDDLPDDDDNDEEDKEEANGASAAGHAPPKSSHLPSVDGMERLELTFKDILCTALTYPHHSILSVNMGSVNVNEKILPRMSMDIDEDESEMLSTTVLQFVDYSPATGRKVHSSSNISVQLRVDFKPDQDVQTIDSLALQIQAQPILLEWDMHILDRAHRYMKMMEESAANAKSSKTSSQSAAVVDYLRKMDLSTDCVEVSLRFPMVNSDLIRFGQSSKRGLCEDKLVLTLEGVKVSSASSDVADEESRDNERKRVQLPWLSEFAITFDQTKVVLITPESGNQRSNRLEKAVMITGNGDATSLQKCSLKLRLQTPSHDDIRAAVVSKKNLSQDSSQHSDAATVGNQDMESVGEDNDGGRVGLNGWSLDAVMRTEQFEDAAADASLFSLDIVIPHASARLMKSTLDRLMVLFDALLMINPIDINGYNQMMATASARHRLMPNYMSVNVLVQEGAFKICDRVPAFKATTTPGTEEDKSILFSYHFTFEKLRIFQVSQWMGQLTSRAHVSARNMTLLEENGETKVVVPIIYKTPYGVSDAPIIFVGVDIADQTQEMREMKVELHFSHVSLRYDVTSMWLFQLLEMVLLEYPAPIIPLDSARTSPEEATEMIQAFHNGAQEVVKLAVPPKTIFTKLFVNFYDVLVDYAPTMLTSRIIIQLGGVSVSSNVVTGAVMQGYKIVAKDLQLFLAHTRSSYEEIDDCILGREMFTRPKQDGKKTLNFALDRHVSAFAAAYPSLLMFLEKNGFLKMVTMDFVDIFLRSLVPAPNNAAASLESKSPASTFPELSVELNLGTANIYACFDSFNTLIELLSTWADQLAIEEEPKDTTAYVGLDRVKDASSVSVVTNLGSAKKKTRTLGSSKGPSSSATTNYVGNDRYEGGYAGKSDLSANIDESYGNRRSSGDSINVLAQIDENAFGGGKHIFPGTQAATDTEARLLRTRLDEIQKQKDRMVNNMDRDDEMSATRLRMKYRQDENKPRIRINELVIEDYYANNASALSGAGAFLMEPESAAPASDNPWFLDRTDTPSTGASPFQEQHPVGSLPDKSAVLQSEQAARWLPPQQSTPPSSGFLDATSPPPSPANFEAVDERLSDHEDIFAMHDIEHATEDAFANHKESFEDELEDKQQFPVGAFPAASKNWWGLQNANEVELSEIQTDGTESNFSRRMDFFEDEGFPMDRIDESGDESTPNAMSMSIIGAGDDEGTEVELDFNLDRDLQSKFNRMMDIESNDGRDMDEMYEDDDEDSNDMCASVDTSYTRHRASYQEMSSPPRMSSPRVITRHASFASSTSSHAVSSTSLNQPTLSPPDEPTARWFYDENTAEGATGAGPPSRIYPHHVEIPIGGAAASLSFGEKESDDAIKSIARENAAMRVVASPPVVIKHVLLRDFNICMRFFGGSDWVSDAQSAASRAALERKPSTPDRNVAPTQVAAHESKPSTERKVKLLDALLDDYVPSPSSASLFGNDSDASGGSSLFTGAKSAPAAMYLHERSNTQGAMNDRGATNTRKRSLKSGRKTEEMLELMVSRIQMRVDMFNDEETQPLASSTVIALGDIEILDYISTSQIRKVICYWKSDITHPRESGSSMVHVHLMTVRPGPNLCEEHRLKVTILPLRINLDQEVVSFLRQFVPVEDPTVRAGAQRQPSSYEEDLEDETKGIDGTEMSVMNAPSTPHLQETDVSLGSWFFQSIDVRPCKIKIDYRPNRVDYAALRSGDYLEVINLFVLEGMELVLRRVKMSGIDGWAAFGEQVLMSWVNDISRHQIHKCVASVSMPPLRPFANIGSGAADLILLPMEHYGKDRRFVRGLKKGAKSFLKSVTIETLNTASRVAQGTQALLEHADDVVSTSSALRKKQLKYRQATSRIRRNSRRMGGGGIRSAQDSGGGIGGRQYLTQQPSNATEGLYQAYDSLSRELHVAAKTIVAVPLVEYKKTGSQGYVRSVIRAVPVAVLRPMIGATEAVSKALIGVRNAVDPELKEDIENKFKDFRGAY
uniref:Autophagy-related protein 2 n=1 Tax=Globisporangium ultimum (strain ATCC 200006 / CBS 805.95 / DAOM BR144) TaxID=431595 RepID=K3X2P4_GLOUD